MTLAMNLVVYVFICFFLGGGLFLFLFYSFSFVFVFCLFAFVLFSLGEGGVFWYSLKSGLIFLTG